MTEGVAILLGGFIAIDHEGHSAKFQQIKDYVFSTIYPYSFTVNDTAYSNGALMYGVGCTHPYWMERVGIWIDYWKAYFGV